MPVTETSTIQITLPDGSKKEAELIREALEKEFTSPEPQKSWYALALELGLIGILKRAPSDLSTNRRHMEGFGRS